ncbi:sulfite exporter TauE/SafE family protein [Polynucleobacter sp. UK-Kesae-W10]|uniref:sulfite exporter TauE/SafE family protein n=1 Tax=Polynucleobacter sp. UK-Kesae-W10 TaxID=1819738 RepID=UPI001C0E7F86|nr:sulfite exporter TauE/SafE family protein [Polynucleobacter sp. UK-Kesae-W10]MBU3576982.1 sulfite exporter TauE/SafE family protein [Polynucleobacter sp. UK-Kesae-W10]
MDSALLISPALGIFVGLLMGLTGAGGGILSVPLLVFALHMNMVDASPVSLSAIALAASVGALIGLKNHLLRYKAAMFMAIFGVILSPVGFWLANRIPNGPLLLLFSGALFYSALNQYRQARKAALGMPEPPRAPPPCLINPSIGKFYWNIPCARALALTGGLAGFLSGLLGVGGGFIIIPALMRYTNLPAQSIIVTSLGVQALISSGSVIFAASTGNFHFIVAAPFSLGALAGLLMGLAISKKLSGPKLQQLFAVMVFGVAISLTIKGIHAL